MYMTGLPQNVNALFVPQQRMQKNNFTIVLWGINSMTIKEKQFLALHARELVKRLQLCEDDEFVDFIISCVVSGDDFALEPENIR